ncbi:MAG TPA: BamA/TamA family outer membrane protein [Gemmatimonadales bacterium]|nr:BamA/TamA family outer membrane protein [Gemmatimonadales bacterium]
MTPAGRIPCLALVAALGACPATAAAQGTDSLHPPARVHLAAGARYRAGWLHRFLLGSHYRDLWATPLDVEVLDLTRFAGGLTPTGCGGRRQTTSIRLRSADGRTYVFRSVDKDPTLALPPDLRRTFARDLLQDQISSAHPGAPLVVAPLLEATGVLHATPRLYALPGDPRLTPFECAQPGMLGMIEERPAAASDDDPGFAGAVELASTQKLFDRLEHSAADRVDARAFLAARLLDVYIGDWDRHQDQWRWARFDAGGVHWWRAIPRDRDQAFARLDGLLVRLAGVYFPQLAGFDDDYPSLFRLTYAGQVLDRRLLSELEQPVWDSTAAALQARLTDSVIDGAVARLPEEYRRGSGARLAQSLRLRRDRLPEAARRFYRLLAGYVDVHATDDADTADLDRRADHSVLRLTAQGTTYFSRSFDPRVTKEIRLYLHGGDDRVVVRGLAGGPLIRVVGGGGDDEMVDSSSGGAVRFYDDRGANRFVRGARTGVDTRRYEAPPIDTSTLGRPRDWGARLVPFTWVSYGSDIGLFLGGGAVRTGYGFRYAPYHTRTTIRAGYATGAASYRATLVHEIRNFPGRATTTLQLRASGIDVVRFYGFGNQTPDTGSTAFYKVPQQQYLVAPTITWPTSSATEVSVGVVVKNATSEPDATRLLGVLRPYGIGNFWQAGVTGGARLDTRDRPAWASHGVLLAVSGGAYPATLDVTKAFGELSAQAATYLTPRHGPTLALRMGGSRMFGPYPFHEAAFIGGATTVRGFPEHRFAGDAALFGNAELRASLAHFHLLVPIEFGGFGLADAGRVFLSGETSDVWHGAAGGGLWFAFLSRTNTLVVAAARSAERTGVYVRAGFAY